MATTLTEALTHEHREIDEGIEAYLGGAGTTPLLDAITELRRHIYLEEELMFPPLRQAGLMMPVMVMLREHGEIWRLMDEVIALADAGDAADPDAAGARCRDLLALLGQHNVKEEPIIYPQADAGLPADVTDRVHDLLESGTMPPGWVCEAAR